MPIEAGSNRLCMCLVVLCAFFHSSSGVSWAGEFDYHSIRRPASPLPPDGIFDGERFFERFGNARVQGLGHYGPHWRGNAHFLWDGKIGDQAKVRMPIRRASRYQLKLVLTAAPDYGIFQALVDGKAVGKRIDLFSKRVELAPVVDLGTFNLNKGNHVLAFKLVGAHKAAVHFRKTNYLFGLDYFQLIDLDPPKPNTAVNKGQPKIPNVTQKTITFREANQLLAKHCHVCHTGKQPRGGIDLAANKTEREMFQRLALAENVLDAITFSTMPPEDAKQLTKRERQQLVQYLDRMIDRSARTLPLAPVSMRRLNRYEYNNAVRDLLKLKGDVYPLPERTIRDYQGYFDPRTGALPDVVTVGNRTLGKFQIERPILEGVTPFGIDLQAEHGFNNRGSELSISPLLLETFVKLGESIVNSPQFVGHCKDYGEFFTGSKPRDQQKDVRLAHVRIRSLLSRAFRMDVHDPLVHRYLDAFVAVYEQTESFESAMKEVVTAILASPRFLYIVESAPAAKPIDKQQRQVTLGDYELATRLSFFLWSTIPDNELTNLAKQGRLSDPLVLREQVNRMMLAKRSRALSENFARQWLRLDQLITATPDFKRFPEYYSRIGCEQWKFGLQMMVEPLLLFESILIEDRSIMLLVDSNYTYRSDELQSWYRDSKPFSGKGNINRFNTFSQRFVRRNLRSRREGGVLTTAATMTMTSSPLRTSPITRGAWVATVFLNQPPQPPPDVVPEIEADDAAIEAKGITLRERLKQHQVNKSCASCHAKIDPLGFVLENYDAVGRWRDQYRSGLPIDASGRLLGDRHFEDIVGFKKVLLDEPEIFTRAFTEHLLSYALGRPLDPADRPAVDRIVRRVVADRGRFSTLIQEIVASRPFRHKNYVFTAVDDD